MEVEILVFGPLAERTGWQRRSLVMAEESTVAAALEALRSDQPEVGTAFDHAAVAVNEAYASPTTRLRAGDCLALIPPVSGG